MATSTIAGAAPGLYSINDNELPFPVVPWAKYHWLAGAAAHGVLEDPRGPAPCSQIPTPPPLSTTLAATKVPPVVAGGATATCVNGGDVTGRLAVLPSDDTDVIVPVAVRSV